VVGLKKRSRGERRDEGQDAEKTYVTAKANRMNAKMIRMPSVKKTWLIDPVLVERAKKITGARTETETVTQALREILIRDEIDQVFRKHGPALADLEDIFESSTVPEK
jgi:hypothetical protein